MVLTQEIFAIPDDDSLSDVAKDFFDHDVASIMHAEHAMLLRWSPPEPSYIDQLKTIKISFTLSTHMNTACAEYFFFQDKKWRINRHFYIRK